MGTLLGGTLFDAAMVAGHAALFKILGVASRPPVGRFAREADTEGA
jgi:hypothetical protein